MGLVYTVIRKSAYDPKHLSVPVCSTKVYADRQGHGATGAVQIVARGHGPPDAKKARLDTHNQASALVPRPSPIPSPPPNASFDPFPDSSNSSIRVNSAAQQSSGAERKANPVADPVDAKSDGSPQDDASHGGLTRPFNIPQRQTVVVNRLQLKLSLKSVKFSISNLS